MGIFPCRERFAW